MLLENSKQLVLHKPENYGLKANTSQTSGYSRDYALLYCYDEASTSEKMRQFGTVISEKLGQDASTVPVEKKEVNVFFTSEIPVVASTESERVLQHAMLVSRLAHKIMNTCDYGTMGGIMEQPLVIFTYGNATELVREALLQVETENQLRRRDEFSYHVSVYSLNGSVLIPNCYASNVVNFVKNSTLPIARLADEYNIIPLPESDSDDFSIFEDLIKTIQPWL